MFWSKKTDRWRSSNSRLIGLYAVFFVAWGAVFTGVLYWEISRYLGTVAERTLMQRAHYYQRVDDAMLEAELAGSEVYSVPGIDAYGLFKADGKHLTGDLLKLHLNLPDDGQVHYLERGLSIALPSEETRSSYALRLNRPDGRILILARDGGSISAVGGIIGQALFWGLSLTLIPGLVGWRLLRRRPIRRVERLQRSTESIVSGNLRERLPLSARRDELDMLANAVNTMLEHIEQLMLEVKSVCDGIAHDLRTPLTRLRARLYQLQKLPLQQAHADTLSLALEESESIMLRFQGLLRISELEDTRRRSAFESFQPEALLQQAHEFYEPLAQEKGQRLILHMSGHYPTLRGDVSLLFEALVNLMDNAIKFTQPGGEIHLSCLQKEHSLSIEVLDNGPGIPAAERNSVTRRLYRGDATRQQPGNGLGLSLVAAIARLHGFGLHIEEGNQGRGTRIILDCPLRGAQYEDS
ncbi:HAMP domain-containing sensor histidine kinase [Pseudomonas sp. 10B1]|uniref:sensor histidine kinase n=1 Tax=unclassified Pseudomonas TaxID=196821 RepID=UPI002B224999|nr:MULTISPECIES: HAMP domain-containing sensor histidine kinase [unclassified Pseudomonas]MEA9993565.1 HAMP domain-containing sensor histidine kinase [Pseudomonas sp. AA4]MEB0087064.1 HAMP domain-containing sensor histidine kinase [Pseudomonas sp. RTI1]MEB0126162.1 HAMP domain-containing sensor histidine kinase [Pseudomonas sp. CCC1.2]MEB0153347.1 HAMP domain-containing sensor histidine kinase [Pseudomonas sp. CCC4.3]MEB0218906.1 HAMP domain-containing sensor histidine kinase [Pseudomonas sp. 